MVAPGLSFMCLLFWQGWPVWSSLWDWRCSGLPGAWPRSHRLCGQVAESPRGWGNCCRRLPLSPSLEQEEKRAVHFRGGGGRLPVRCPSPPAAAAAAASSSVGVQVGCRLVLWAGSSLSGVGLCLRFLNDCFLAIWHHTSPGIVNVKTPASFCGGAAPGAG